MTLLTKSLVRVRDASLAVATLAALGTPRVAFAAPSYVPVQIRSEFPEEDPERVKRIQPSLEGGAADKLKLDHDVRVVEGASTTLVFRVINLHDNPKTQRQRAVMDYGVRIEVEVDGETVGQTNVYCLEKGESELVACAVEGLPEVLPYVPTTEPPDKSPPATPDPTSAQSPEEGKPTGDRIPAIRGVGIAGIVVGVAGVGLAVGGAVELGRGDVMQTQTLAGSYQVTDHRPRGRVLLGVGIGFVVVGAVMVGVDVGLQSKKRREKQRARLDLNVGKDYASVGVRGRF